MQRKGFFLVPLSMGEVADMFLKGGLALDDLSSIT